MVDIHLQVWIDIQRKNKNVFMTWLLSRYSFDGEIYTLYFVEVKNLLLNEDVVVSKKTFTPKIPNSATYYSLIYTFIKTIMTYSNNITCRMSFCSLTKKCIIPPSKSDYYDFYDLENWNMCFFFVGAVFRQKKWFWQV